MALMHYNLTMENTMTFDFSTMIFHDFCLVEPVGFPMAIGPRSWF